MAQCAQRYGYSLEIILVGRWMNDSKGEYVASKMVKCMIKKGQVIKNAKVLVLGITFKENCPDVRNTKVVDVITALKDYGTDVAIYDPWASAIQVKHEYGLDTISELPDSKYDAVILAVAHNEFKKIDIEILKAENGAVFDVKCVFPKGVDARL